ncbi:MAG: CoA transferase [Acidimicrobiaceae bacterium]|nr:CoA transferase [Acidimicrobiaceae bacterium]
MPPVSNQDFSDDDSRSGPLKDLLVIDISRVLSGPYAAMLLGDLGARVIKVERPSTGDDTRAWGPPFVGPEGNKESAYFLSTNRNKESIVLDFNSKDDLEVLKALVKRADVLIENFRLGVLERLGISHAVLQSLNPALVVLSITGFGHFGKGKDRPGYDQIIQGESGLMSFTGPDKNTPTKVGVPIADILTGIFGALGVTSALHERSKTGLGQVVGTSLLASAIAVHTYQGTRWLVANEVPEAEGNLHPTVSPYGSFRCVDGFIQIAVGNDSLWRKFAVLVGLDPDDGRFATNPDRVTNRRFLAGLIEEALSVATVKAWIERLGAIGVPVGEVRSLDKVYQDPQVIAEKMIIETLHATLGEIRLPGSPLQFERGRETHTAPPTLGEHSEAIREWLERTSE